MADGLSEVERERTRFLIGDVRDRPRVSRAAEGVDVVVHAAALKQVVSCEYNPFEAVKTNVVGSQNVVEACLDAGVERAVLLSSDKAVHPVNVYGASKLAAEKCWAAANAYGGGRCRFTTVRYGNVRGSRGSVLDAKDPVRLTDRRATRFWMDVEDAVELVLLALREARGGEVFVPKLRASRIVDVSEFVWAEAPETGLRPGEKLHEVLISDEEIPRTLDFGDHYRIVSGPHYVVGKKEKWQLVPADFKYTSEAVTAA